jgi:tetratricopeptide (TPR) repeat protein
VNRRSAILGLAASAALLSAPHIAEAASPRATLVTAAFETSGKKQALALVNSAIGTLNATLAKDAGNRDAQLQQGIAYGYRGKLTNSIGDARKARDLLTRFVQRNPSDPEGQVALGGWHLTVLSSVGSFVGGTIGASKSKGIAALDRAVKLGGNRAFFPAYAGLSRIALDSGDAAGAKALLEKATGAAAPSEVDRITRSAARQVLALLRQGKAKEAASLAQDLLPFGRVP